MYYFRRAKKHAGESLDRAANALTDERSQLLDVAANARILESAVGHDLEAGGAGGGHGAGGGGRIKRIERIEVELKAIASRRRTMRFHDSLQHLDPRSWHNAGTSQQRVAMREVPACQHCGRNFTVVLNRKVCHKCGDVTCEPCARFSRKLTELGHYEPVRLCNLCDEQERAASALHFKRLFLERQRQTRAAEKTWVKKERV